eukprot:g735.t1
MPVPCTNHKFALCELPGGELSTGPHVALPPGLDKIVSMASDDAFVFAAMYTGQLIKMNQLDMNDLGVLNLNVELGALAVDATHAYVCANNPTRLIKVNTELMTQGAQYTLQSTAFAILEHGDYVYLGLETSPGQVLKLEKLTLNLVSSSTLPVGGTTAAAAC